MILWCLPSVCKNFNGAFILFSPDYNATLGWQMGPLEKFTWRFIRALVIAGLPLLAPLGIVVHC